MRIALVQPARASRQDENLRRMRLLVSQVPAVDLVLLPENWLGPFSVALKDYLRALDEIAALLPPETLLAGGAQYVDEGGRFYSRGYFLRHAARLAFYEKCFPSQAVGERDHLLPGRPTPVLEHAGWKLGALVCIDLFYPEVARWLALQGAQLILNPVSIHAGRSSFWQALGQVRAAENTVFVAVANNTGSAYPDGREVTGGSFVALPDGRLGAVAGSEETVLLATLDAGLVEDVRKRWPYLEDARRGELRRFCSLGS